MKKVMVFGSFDGLHDTHRAMLKEAKSLGDQLIVVVHQDHIVKHITGEFPKLNLTERFEHLEKQDGVDKVVIGDAELSTWNIVKRHKPKIIALGDDQEMLKKDLEWQIKGKKLAYNPEIRVLHYSETNEEK